MRLEIVDFLQCSVDARALINIRQFFFKYGGHAATLLIYFIFWGARAEDRTRGCLTAARRATCMLRRH